MFFLLRKRQPKHAVLVSGRTLFTVLQEDLSAGLCSEIVFHMLDDTVEHSFGAYGDGGEARHHIRFFFDGKEYESYAALREKAVLNHTKNLPLHDHDALLVVTKHNGRNPRNTKTLAANDYRAHHF